MLQSYSLEGFTSFKHLTEVDLKRTQYQTLESTNVADGILKGCMFVGGNASGKTNLIAGLRFLLYVLFSERNLSFDRFLCLFSERGILENTYTFLVDGQMICYKFRYQKQDRLLMEHLYVDNRLMMERVGSQGHTELSERKNFNDLRNDTVFLRYLWFNTKFSGHKVLQHWFDFLAHSKCLNTLTGHIIGFTDQDDSTIEAYLESNGVEEINSFFAELGMGYSLVLQPALQQDGHPFSGLSVKRDGIDEPIPMAMESMGNQTLLQILPAYFSVMKQGGMLICDEFSSALHNDLEELLVRYFMKHSGHAQIFIVSHSTNLLDSRLFRPDQLYAVNFDREGSNIVRFSSEQPRTSQNYEKMYLGGVFSGLPRYHEI